MKQLVLCIAFLMFSFSLSSQAGIEFVGGMSKASNNNRDITPEGEMHPGHFVGADISFTEGKMYFLIGGQYHNQSFVSKDKMEFFDHEHSLKWLKLRAGLGFELIRLSSRMVIKAKALGIINTLVQYPENHLEQPYHKFNSGTAGLAANLGVEYAGIGIQLEYEKGFFNAVNQVENTEFDFLSLGLSIRI